MKQNETKWIIIVLAAIILIAGTILAVKVLSSGEEDEVVQNNLTQEEEVKEAKKVQIVDEESTTRPYAVMINNNHEAWPQCGLKDAYLVYEIIVEGGITRMMALYKDQDTAKIGSVRSSRHYFIDYALENDAIYVHWGASTEASQKLGSIDNIDGMELEGSVFFRDRTLDRAYEHTGFTSMEKVKKYAEKQGFTREANKDLLLNYSAEEIDMTKLDNVEPATSVEIEYSYYHTTSYEYDEENKVYKRSMSNKPNVDLETGEQYTAKNIIIYAVRNYSLGSGGGKQELDNLGSGSGYLVTGGYSVPITWEKETHSSQTIYRYTNGEEIVVNDGNTFIQICPLDAEVTIEAEEPIIQEEE